MIPGACQITFVGMDAVEAAKVEVRAWLPRLGALTDQVTAGHVFVEAIDENRKERRYRVRMELTMREGLVGVTHDHPINVPHEDVYVAIRNAFRAARRQLEDYFKTRSASGETEAESRIEIAEPGLVGAQAGPSIGAVPDLPTSGGIPATGHGMEFEDGMKAEGQEEQRVKGVAGVAVL